MILISCFHGILHTKISFHPKEIVNFENKFSSAGDFQKYDQWKIFVVVLCRVLNGSYRLQICFADMMNFNSCGHKFPGCYKIGDSFPFLVLFLEFKLH